MIKVFYDGECGLCRREIGHYRKIAPPDRFDWVDITKASAELEAVGLTFDRALRRLHAQDAQGALHKGVDAFLLIWRHLPRWRFLAPLVAFPLIKPIADFAYDHFADWRIDRLHAARCAIDPSRITSNEKS